LVGLRSTSWPPPKSNTQLFRRATFLITGAFSLAVIFILTALLQLRGFSVLSLGGFSRLGFGRIVSTAAVLLFAAYPLLFAADGVSRWLLGEGSSKQQIVEMFTGSETLHQRVLIIVLAITIAPMAEEFIFRFFLYGVLKRYLGRGAGLVFEFTPFCRCACALAKSRTALYPRRVFHPGL
jgi:membrane protease YdiL (CAAX protease family)